MKKIEKYWNSSCTRAKYLYNWSFDNKGKPGTTFYLNKIHNRTDYKWTNPVHEVLKSNKEEKVTPDILAYTLMNSKENVAIELLNKNNVDSKEVLEILKRNIKKL